MKPRTAWRTAVSPSHATRFTGQSIAATSRCIATGGAPRQNIDGQTAQWQRAQQRAAWLAGNALQTQRSWRWGLPLRARASTPSMQLATIAQGPCHRALQGLPAGLDFCPESACEAPRPAPGAALPRMCQRLAASKIGRPQLSWTPESPATRNRARDHLISAISTVRCSTN